MEITTIKCHCDNRSCTCGIGVQSYSRGTKQLVRFDLQKGDRTLGYSMVFTRNSVQKLIDVLQNMLLEL